MNAETIARKVDPAHLRVSPRFTAVLAYLVGETWTDPAIVDMTITSDGIVMLATTDDPLFDEILGDRSDLERNIRGVADVVGLTTDETDYLLTRAGIRSRPMFEAIGAYDGSGRDPKVVLDELMGRIGQ